MPRPVDTGRRTELLDRLIEAVSSGGIGDRSLRDLAEAAGTSHRMLIHHFGSRDGLLLALVEEMERRQAVALTELPDDPADAVAAQWADLRRPEVWPVERLFFECYARATQGEEPYARMLPGAVDDWLSVVRDQAPDADPAMVRLGLAVTRGLLLDLVATGDVDGVDAAHAAWVSLLRSSSGLRPH